MNKTGKWLIAVYLTIWGISLGIFLTIWTSDDGIGYSLIFLYILIPLTTAVLSFLAGLKNTFGKWAFIWIIAMGIMYMLSEYFSFSMANTMVFHKMNMPELGMIPTGIIISAAGYFIGRFIRKRKEIAV